ncbi:MAG: hypothetical protein GXY44_01140 [Phycisphaerales bacterium]|nr:hypothetical protein [Phycisphaerales bacterium]
MRLSISFTTVGLVAILAVITEAGPQTDPYVENNGVIAFEAEAYTTQVGFQEVVFDGTTSMQAVGGSDSRLDYVIQVDTPGRFQIRIRAYALDHMQNGLYLALNGQLIRAPADHPLAGTADIYLQKVGWSWDPEWLGDEQHIGPVTVDLQIGQHVFSIRKRKDENPLIDKIQLVRTSSPDTEPPSVPTNVQATPISWNSISLMWTASTDNVGVAGYKIYRNGNSQPIGTSPTPGYTDTGLQPEATYSYQVSAYDDAQNESGQSSPPAVTATLTRYALADFDQDGDVDLEDFGLLQRCYGIVPVTGACIATDLNSDGFVNLTDFDIFRNCMSGANSPADPDCWNP